MSAEETEELEMEKWSRVQGEIEGVRMRDKKTDNIRKAREREKWGD